MLDWHEELIKLRRAEYFEEHGDTPENHFRELSSLDEPIEDGATVIALYFNEESEEENVV